MNYSSEKLKMLEVAEANHRHREQLGEVLSNRNMGEKENEQGMRELTDFLFDENEAASPRDEKIFKAWIKNGVRFDTAHWLRSLAVHFGDKSLATPEACIAALFIDTYNRADDILDTFRQHFSNKRGEISTQDIRRVPILPLADGTAATVGDFMDLTHKLIHSSGAYSEEEIEELTSGIQMFLEESREAIEKHEKNNDQIIGYSEKDAVSLREHTLFPLVTVVCQIYSSIKYHGGISGSQGRSLEDEMRSLAMAAQVLDDRNDYKGDFVANNTNMTLGIIADVCREMNLNPDARIIAQLSGGDWHDEDSDTPDDESQNEITKLKNEVNNRLNKLLAKYHKHLNPKAQSVIPNAIKV